MPLMVDDLYFALLDAGASEELSRRAAQAAAGVDTRFAALEGRMAGTEVRRTVLDGRMVGLDSRFLHLMWGFGIGFSVAMLLLKANWLWQVVQRLPRIP
jgi:hypothetical protein